MSTPGRKRGWTDEQLRDAVLKSRSVRQVFLHMGLRVGGGQHLLIKQRIKALGINTSHFMGKGWNKKNVGGQLRPVPLTPIEDVLVRDSDYTNTGHLKQRLLAANMLENRCALCRLLPEWNGKPLVLRLDHINGIRNDHRLENLRLLCPNCDSQTPTFAGRNKGRADPVE